MTLEIKKIFNENDIEIHEDGISVTDTFFNKSELASTFNEMFFMKRFIEKHSE